MYDEANSHLIPSWGIARGLLDETAPGTADLFSDSLSCNASVGSFSSCYSRRENYRIRYNR